MTTVPSSAVPLPTTYVEPVATNGPTPSGTAMDQPETGEPVRLAREVSPTSPTPSGAAKDRPDVDSPERPARAVPAGHDAVTVQKITVRYAKRGRLRFASARDLQRVFERALRRADIPMAYSQGFTAHPKIAYLGAAPTGAASEAEYLELGLAQPCEPGELASRLDTQMPPGLAIVGAWESEGNAAHALEVSRWEIALPGMREATAQSAVTWFLAQSEVLVDKPRGGKQRRVDVRAAVIDLTVMVRPGAATPEPGDRCAILGLVVRHTTPAVRPDDVVSALRGSPDFDPPFAPVATRTEQGGLVDGSARVSGYRSPAS